MKIKAGILSIGLLVLSTALLPQVPSGREVVKPKPTSRSIPRPAAAHSKIAVVMKIRPGFHVNAREKIGRLSHRHRSQGRTSRRFQRRRSLLSQGQAREIHVSKTPLNVYQGTLTLRMPITTLANAPLGEQHIPLKLRYQACSPNSACPGHRHSRRHAQRRRFGLRRQVRARGNLWKAIGPPAQLIRGQGGRPPDFFF